MTEEINNKHLLEASNYENLLHQEQRKIKKFIEVIKTLSIKHYSQEQYADIIDKVYKDIFNYGENYE